MFVRLPMRPEELIPHRPGASLLCNHQGEQKKWADCFQKMYQTSGQAHKIPLQTYTLMFEAHILNYKRSCLGTEIQRLFFKMSSF